MLSLFTTFKVIETVIFKKMCFKNITKMAVIRDLIPLCKGHFTSYADHHSNKVIELANF